MSNVVVRAAAGGTGPLGPLFPEPYDLLWSAVVFVIILFVVIRFGLPRIAKVLDDRAAKIEGNIQQAEEAEKRAQALLEQYTAQLADARAEAGRIRDQAREDGKRILAELRDQAQAESARITAQAQAQIQSERESAVQSLRAEVGSLALGLASGVVGQHLQDDANASALVDQFLAELETTNASDAAGARTSDAGGAAAHDDASV